MERRKQTLLGAVVAVALLSLAAQPALDWLRSGNAAYLQGDYSAAVQAYDKAEALTSDPGQVAFNRAAALYQLGAFSSAEKDYQRSLEDADGTRRVQALYGLGNALARQGCQLHGRAAVARLLAAGRAYEACLAEERTVDEATRSACRETFADARYNWKLLEPLLARKRAEAAQEPPPQPGDGNDQSDDRGNPDRDNGGNQATKKSGSPAGPQPDPRRQDGAPKGPGDKRPGEGAPPAPGQGGLPNLLDDRDAPAMAADAARDALQAHLDRMRRERSQRTGTPPPHVRHVKDW